MGALLLLIVCWAVGRGLYALLFERSLAPIFQGKAPLLPEWVVREPISWVAGSVAMGWLIYLTAWLAQGSDRPLVFGNGVALAAAIPFVWLVWRARRRPASAVPPDPADRSAHLTPAILLVVGGLGFALLCAQALRVESGKVFCGLSVFSDYGPHLAVMRSFSLGHNFPTEYPHFPDGSARYHFFFQFFAGNLEFLGLRLDWALNLPSVLAFVSAIAVLYSLACCLTQSRAGGVLTVGFFFFRPGVAAYDFLMAGDGWKTFLTRLVTNDQFIGRTRHEDWGLWNQNVYLNQRHLALGLTVAFFALLHAYVKLSHGEDRRLPWLGWFSKAGWISRDRHQLFASLGVGLLIGGCGFWNGATVIASLLMLGVLAFFSPHRLEWLGLAAVAGALCFAENRLFLRAGELAVAPEVVLGFLSEGPVTWASVGSYLLNLLGVQPFLLVLGVLGCAITAFARKRPEDRGSIRGYPLPWLLAFLAPLILAFTVRLTPDIAINHKYVMVSVMLLNVFVAVSLVALWRLALLLRPLAVVLVFAMTITGVIDLFTLIRKNSPDRSVLADTNDPVHQWLVANTNPRDRLLTDWYSYHMILLTGRKIFYGWPYYAWGAGYDVRGREEIVKQIYGATDWPRTLQLLIENKIAYVIIDDGNRRQDLYKLQEDFLRQHLQVAFENRDTVVLRVPRE